MTFKYDISKLLSQDIDDMTQNCTTVQSSIFLFSFQENKMQIMGTT